MAFKSLKILSPKFQWSYPFFELYSEHFAQSEICYTLAEQMLFIQNFHLLYIITDCVIGPRSIQEHIQICDGRYRLRNILRYDIAYSARQVIH